MKDRALGLLTTAALLALPGLILIADRWTDAADRMATNPAGVWAVAIALLALVGILLGIEKRGYWDGLLIDATNRKSLSRLQALVWGTLIVSGIAAGMAVNVARGCRPPAEGETTPAGSCTDSPWDLHYPEQFLVLAALSAMILVLATVVNGANAQRTLNAKGRLSALRAGLVAPDASGDLDGGTTPWPPNAFYGVIAGKDDVARSSWSDIAKGDVGAHAAYLDLARVQFLIVTFLVAGAYAVFYLRELTDPAGSVQFPEFDAGINTLLGISAAAYLAVKAVNGVSAGD